MRAAKWRGLRVLRNLCFVLLSLLILWGQYRFPMPTAELRFRQLESWNLMEPSQIVYLWKNPLSVKEASSGDPRHIVIGRYSDQYSVGYLYELPRSGANVLEFWPAGEGPVPISLHQSLFLEGKGTDKYSVLAFLQVPAEAASAQVTITGRMENMLDPIETAQGKRLAEEIWAFAFPIDPNLTSDGAAGRKVRYWGRALEGLPYTLELYREDGSLLLEQSGNLPESGLADSYSMTFYYGG